MNVLSSLRSRVFLTSALIAVLSMGAAIYLVSDRVTREAENSLRREIASTREMVENVRTSRTEMFTTMARLVADAPKLKAAADTNDPPTVQDIASEYQQQLGSSLLLVTNTAGTVLATVGVDPRAAVIVASQPAVRAAIKGREEVSLLPQPEGMLQLVTVPILLGVPQPDILGTLSVGFLLDSALAQRLKQMTGSEIAFGMDGQILASTLPDEDRPVLSRLMRASDEPRVVLREEEYAVSAIPLSDIADAQPGAGPVTLILRSRTEHLSFLRALHAELAITAVVALLLAILLSFAVARTITQPLAAITGVMREVAATGDLARKITLRPGRWNDEDARLLASTFNGLTDSIARFQREMSQRERLSSLGRLSTVIAHEIRNPLMIIKTALHTLRQPQLAPGAVREAAADIDDEVTRLNRIVNDVLDFARPIAFELGPVDLNGLCRESVTAAEATPGVQVRLDLDPSLPHAIADAERLRIALVNLLVNARQAVEPREPTSISSGAKVAADGTGRAEVSGHAETHPQVTLTTRHQGGRAVIVLADNGAGIGHSDVSHVFDPYFTTKRGGTGLGLPIAKNIVEGLGGTLVVESAPGHGTAMRIELPLPPAPQAGG